MILKHQLFEDLYLLNQETPNLKTADYIDPFDKAARLKETVNPFDESIFSYLSVSVGLEGSMITAGETKELILNDIYTGKPQKDIQMVKNLNEALYYVFKNLDEKITEGHIKELNRIILFSLHRNAGKYKVAQNKIQGNPDFKTAYSRFVPHLMEDYVSFINRVDTGENCLKGIGKIHNELQGIHPFSDGNSRTIRMLVNWMLMKFEFPLVIIRMGCFDAYMFLSKLAQSRDDEGLSVLFQRLLIHESLNN